MNLPIFKRLGAFLLKPKGLLCVAFLIVSGLVVCKLRGFWGNEICTRCGKQLDYREWIFGFDGPTLWTVKREESDTPLSSFLTANGTVANCKHDWCFASGGDYPV